MLNNTALQNNTDSQNSKNTFYTNPTRAIWTTVGLGVSAFVALLLANSFWLALLNEAPLDKRFAAYSMLNLYSLIVPIAIAGAYWLALLRLRRVRALQTWFEAIGLSLLYFVGIGALMGAGSYYLTGYVALAPALDQPWWVFTLFSEVPQMILNVLILVLGAPTIALAFALLFARWREVRLAHLPGSGWLDFLVVLGVSFVVLLLTWLAYAYVPFASVPEKFFVTFIVPGAIMCTLVSWWMYRTMFKAWQNMPATTELASDTKK